MPKSQYPMLTKRPMIATQEKEESKQMPRLNTFDFIETSFDIYFAHNRAVVYEHIPYLHVSMTIYISCYNAFYD
jgi:hypothetical protein